MIKLEKVNKYFNKNKKNEIHVIDNTSVSFDSTGLVCLLGPSGCGKTTLLNVIGGLDKVKSGKIYVNGKKITKKSTYYVDKERNLNIGYIFQNYNLLENLTVFDNVAIALKMVGVKNKKEIEKRVNFVLETLKIYRYRNRPAGMLSGGEKQRVAIARAIVKNPNILLCDEPTGNLDSQNTLEIMNIIKSISKNRLVILVTHENDIAKFYADRIIEVSDGKIVKDYENSYEGSLDYKIDNKIYLKDFKTKEENGNITLYFDNNIKSIESAVLFGRTIFKSIRKFIIFQLTMNLIALFLSIVGPLLGISTPITIMQMLWLNMIMDTLSGLAYSYEYPIKRYMKEKPIKKDEPILNKYMYSAILLISIYSFILLSSFLKSDIVYMFIRNSRKTLMTAFFSLFVFISVFNAFNARTERLNLFANILKNKVFIVILLFITLAQIFLIYNGGSLFRTYGLKLNELIFVIALAFTVIPLDLVRKLFIKYR